MLIEEINETYDVKLMLFFQPKAHHISFVRTHTNAHNIRKRGVKKTSQFFQLRFNKPLKTRSNTVLNNESEG